jgi:threonylcarbamoyladenosine tRNA methylthiotransferase MtaB
MYSVALYPFGCTLNQLEREAVAGAFKQAGFSLCSWDETAAAPDLLIINTCTVTSKADQKARRIIRKALRDNPRSCVIVTGCYAQLEREALESLERPAPGGRRLFIPRGGTAAGAAKSVLLDLPGFIREAAGTGEGCAAGHDPAALRVLVEAWHENRGPPGAAEAGAETFRFAPKDFSFHTRGYLKIQDGCDNHCTYCRVRLARGPSVSRSAEAVLAELRALEAQGYAEAMLTGVNITQYRDQGGGLGELLRRLLEGTSRIALRLSSLEPEGVGGELAAALAHRRIRPHFHLSVQSGSAAILKKMGRTYGPETVEQAAALLRSVQPDPFMACDIITGFPGETEADFAQTRALCENTGFAWIHAFPYSKRPGTPACSFPEPVSERDAARRVETLLELARLGRRDYVRSWTGRETEVLVEGGGPLPAGRCRGTSANYLKLLVKYRGPQAPLPGAVLRCEIREPPLLRENPEYDAEAEELPI